MRSREGIVFLLLTVATAVLVAAAARDGHLVGKLSALLVALYVLRWCARNVTHALVAMLIIVPVQQPLLAYLYAHGLPAVAARNLGFYKEVVAVAVIVAAISAARDRPWSLTLLDWTVAVYVLVVLAFAVIPVVFKGTLGGQPFSVLLLSFRGRVLFLILLVGCRRLLWTASDLRRMSVAVVVAALTNVIPAVWERYDNASFIRFVNNTLHFTAYRIDILGQAPSGALGSIYTPGAGEAGIRVGGWQFDALGLSFLMILPLCLGVRWLAVERNRGYLWPVNALLVVTLLLTLTRSAIAAAGLAVVLVIAAVQRRRLPGRTRLALGLALASLAILPLVGLTGLADRLQGAASGKDASALGHVSATREAFDFVQDHPAGVGLATRSLSLDAQGRPLAAAENAYLEIGVELGVVPMLLFVVIAVLTQRELSARRRPDHPEALAVWAAGWGLAFVGLFLSVWLPFAVALAFWTLAGVTTANAQEANADVDASKAHHGRAGSLLESSSL